MGETNKSKKDEESEEGVGGGEKKGKQYDRRREIAKRWRDNE